MRRSVTAETVGSNPIRVAISLVEGEIKQSTIVNTDFSVKLPPAAQLQYGALICGLAKND